MNFGRDGAKSSCKLCDNERLAKLEDKALETKILYCWNLKLIEIIDA